MPKPANKSTDKSKTAGKEKPAAKAPAKSKASPAKAKPPSSPAKATQAKPAATKPAAPAAKVRLEPDLPLPGIGVGSRSAPLPGLGARKSSAALPGIKAPPKAEPKGAVPLAPGKAFDPKSEDWRNRHGKGQAGSGAPPNRPFKGGARGR